MSECVGWEALERCPCCGAAPVRMIWVHSHEQTACCGAVLGPCCQPQEAPTDSEPARQDTDR